MDIRRTGLEDEDWMMGSRDRRQWRKFVQIAPVNQGKATAILIKLYSVVECFIDDRLEKAIDFPVKCGTICKQYVSDIAATAK